MADDDLIQRAVAHFGTTEDPRESGYILPDGRHLALMGRHYASGYENKKPKRGQPDYLTGQRNVDHRELDDLTETGDTKGMFDFMRRSGAVRHMPESGGVSVIGMPTDAQLRAMLRAHGRAGLIVDVDHPDTMETLASQEFRHPTMEALKTFFSQHVTKKAEGGAVDDAMPPQRDLSPVGLYSHASEVADSLPQMKGTPQQFAAMLAKQGVKPDELKWSGYDDAFKDQKLITKQQLAQHFKAKMPKVRMLSDTPPQSATSQSPSRSIWTPWIMPALPAAHAAPSV